MSFVTVTFAVILAVVFGLHWVGPRKNPALAATWQKWVLLVASYVFYGWWDWRFCGLMLVSALTGYLVANAMGRTDRAPVRRRLLAVSLVVDLGILGFFKYFGFFADTFALAMAGLGIDVDTATTRIILPVGISFYTFQSVSYVIDVYRGRAPEPNLALHVLYLAFFPQLVAGPIERAGDLLGQLRAARRFDPELAVSGCRLALWGVVKKVLFADPLGRVADEIFARGVAASPLEIVIATLAFAFQIYGDFSGYSDIAAGVGRLFGIRLSRNFRYPYFARDLRDFWRRWHITFSSWLRDFVFIPLGGSRGPLRTTLRNILLTLLLSGLWHGAAWHYVAWGAWHAAGLMAGRRSCAASGFGTRPNAVRFPPWLAELGRVGATFAFVSLGWIWFRAPDLGEAAALFGRLLGGWREASLTDLHAHGRVLAVIPLWMAVEWLGRDRWDPIAWERVGRRWRWLGYTGLVWCVLLFGPRRMTEFIYFQF
ncbi:MAG: MBOAT family protein [Limisphaerales bacterium]